MMNNGYPDWSSMGMRGAKLLDRVGLVDGGRVDWDELVSLPGYPCPVPGRQHFGDWRDAILSLRGCGLTTLRKVEDAAWSEAFRRLAA